MSDGGLFTALVEMGSPRSLGFDVESDSEVRLDAFLFGEAQGRIVITTTEADQEDFLDAMSEAGIPVTLLGHTTKGKCVVDGQHYGFITEYETAMETAIPEGHGPISWALLRSLTAHAPAPLPLQPNLLGPIGRGGGAGRHWIRGVEPEPARVHPSQRAHRRPRCGGVGPGRGRWP